MKTSWVWFRNTRVHIFYLSENDSPKFLSISRTLGCINGLFHYVLPHFERVILSFHLSYLSRGHNFHSICTKLVILKLKLKFRTWTFTSFWNHLNWSFMARDTDDSKLLFKLKFQSLSCFFFTNFPSFMQGSNSKGPMSALVQENGLSHFQALLFCFFFSITYVVFFYIPLLFKTITIIIIIIIIVVVVRRRNKNNK